MTKIISLAVGAFFSLALLVSFGTGAYNQLTDPPPKTAEKIYAKHDLKALDLPSNGVFGKFDGAQLQRGFAV